MPKSVTYVIIEPNELIRDGIHGALTRTLGPASALAGALSEVSEAGILDATELVVADLGDTPESVFLAVRELRSSHPSLKLLILANSYDPAHMLSAIQAGADGHQVKTATRELVAQSVAQLMLGGLVLPSAFREILLKMGSTSQILPPSPLSAPRSGNRILSDQEERILRRILEGASNKMIARDFGLSDSTVKTHVKSVFRKIRVENRTKAALWARDNLVTDRENRSDGSTTSQEEALPFMGTDGRARAC